MSRVLKSMMAQFSYFLEKYYGITSILWTIIFMAFCCALLVGTSVKFAEIIYHKKKKEKRSLYFSYVWISIILSYIMNRLIVLSFTWDSKLQRVMNNFNYILSFESNRDLFFNGLNIPANEMNIKGLFNIALYLNHDQWFDIIKQSSGSGWYFVKVSYAIEDILQIGNTHLTLNVIYQNIYTYIPFVLIIFLGIYLLSIKKKLSGYSVIAAGLFSLLFSFGGAIFMCLSLYLGIFCGIMFDLSKKQLSKLENLKIRNNV